MKFLNILRRNFRNWIRKSFIDMVPYLSISFSGALEDWNDLYTVSETALKCTYSRRLFIIKIVLKVAWYYSNEIGIFMSLLNQRSTRLPCQPTKSSMALRRALSGTTHPSCQCIRSTHTPIYRYQPSRCFVFRHVTLSYPLTSLMSLAWSMILKLAYSVPYCVTQTMFSTN